MAQTYKSMTLKERETKRRHDEKVKNLRQKVWSLQRKLKEKDKLIEALSLQK